MEPNPAIPTIEVLGALSNTRGISGLPFMQVGATPGYPRRLAKEWYVDRTLRELCALRVFKSATDGALQCSVMPGRFYNGKNVLSYAGATGYNLTNNATNYIWLNTDGNVSVGQTGWPADAHLPLATIVTSGGTYSADPADGAIIDYRPLFSVAMFTTSAASTLTGGAASNADALHVHGYSGLDAACQNLFNDNLKIYKTGSLTYGCTGGVWRDGLTFSQLAASTNNALIDATANYIFINSSGVLTCNTTGWPTVAHIRLAVITPAAGTYTDAQIEPWWLWTNSQIMSSLTLAQISTLTGGSVSNADALHRHSMANLLDFSVSYDNLSAACQNLFNDNLKIYKTGNLTYGCTGGVWRDGSTWYTLAASTGNALTDATANYIFINSSGVLTRTTTGWPTSAHVRLAVITPAAGTYTDSQIEPWWLYAGTARIYPDGYNADTLHIHSRIGDTSPVPTGVHAAIVGGNASSSAAGQCSVALNSGNAPGMYATGIGVMSNATRYAGFARSTGAQVVAGDRQRQDYMSHGTTTSTLGAVICLPSRFTLEDEKSYACTVTIHGRQDTGANHAMFKRMCIIHRTGGTVALAGTVQTIGTDIKTDASWTVTLSANNTAKSLDVTAYAGTGQNVAWLCDFEALEIGYND